MQQQLFANPNELAAGTEDSLGVMSDWVEFYSNWLGQSSGSGSKRLLSDVINSVDWQQPEVRVFNQYHKIPRQQAWFGDEGIRYVYSGVVHRAVGWPTWLNNIKNDVNNRLNCQFNSALLNRYRNGNDKMGWHADNESELGSNPAVAILSIGANRDIQFKHLATKKTASVSLTDGSLLFMKPGTQHHFHHQIPVRRRVFSERISITFRQIITR